MNSYGSEGDNLLRDFDVQARLEHVFGNVLRSSIVVP